MKDEASSHQRADCPLDPARLFVALYLVVADTLADMRSKQPMAACSRTIDFDSIL